MQYQFQVDPKLMEVLSKTPFVLDLKSWPDEALSICLREMKESNDAILGSENKIPLPMPNLLYLATVLLENAQDQGRLPMFNNVMQLCTELHKVMAAEVVARSGGQSVQPLDCVELVSRSRVML